MTERRGFLKSLMAGTVAGIPAVKSVEVLEVKPAELLVITFPKSISYEAASRLKEVFARELPGVKALVLGDGAELRVVKTDA